MHRKMTPVSDEHREILEAVHEHDFRVDKNIDAIRWLLSEFDGKTTTSLNRISEQLSDVHQVLERVEDDGLKAQVVELIARLNPELPGEGLNDDEPTDVIAWMAQEIPVAMERIKWEGEAGIAQENAMLRYVIAETVVWLNRQINFAYQNVWTERAKAHEITLDFIRRLDENEVGVTKSTPYSEDNP